MWLFVCLNNVVMYLLFGSVMMFLRINKVNLELELNDFFVMCFLINNFLDNMC